MKRFLFFICLCVPAVSYGQIPLAEDTAYTTLAVNVAPLVDATDGTTIEEAIAYNATGMDLQWNFINTSTGAKTTTTVTPTTGGDYDWSHQDGGMYVIEMPASGGASANNDTAGIGWFSGTTDACLPFVGPKYAFGVYGSVADTADAVWDESRGETTGVPGATDTMVNKINVLYQALIFGYENTTSNGGEKRYKDSGGSVEWEKDLTDNGTTYTESAAGTPD